MNRALIVHPAADLSGRTVALATMHGKEIAFARAFATIGLPLVVPARLDTDRFGTFSGEIARTASMRQTAIAKANAAMDLTGLDLGLASEGSFGPHPVVPFVAAGIELVVLVDRRHGRIHSLSRLMPRTNFTHAVVTDRNEAAGFLARVGFPDHAVIVRPGGEDRRHPPLAKGVTDEAAFDRVLAAALLAGEGRALIETDMRAHLNPTRMAGLSDLAGDFAKRLASPCPACAAPGFGATGSLPGLACAECGTPTGDIRGVLFGCEQCGHEESRPRQDGKNAADPSHCPLCNP